jgi:phosphopantothenoylcysteine decarboxylase / phosphopantothenate---cysteine ligase
MNNWDFTPPPPSDLGDHDVPREGSHLEGKRIALLITGGIASMKAPFIVRALRKQGADVVVFASEEAMRYTTIDALEWSSTNQVVTRLTSKAEHLSDSAPFNAYLIAPATYNTINKISAGTADNVITTTFGSALGRMEQGKTQILIAPTMHGSLHNSILTGSLKKLEGMGIRIIPPREAYGKHNIPHESTLVAEVCRAVSQSSLKNRSILVTGGPTPVKIDNVRRITNRFRGKLGVEISKELYLRGANVLLIHGDGAYRPPASLPYRIARTYDDYREIVNQELSNGNYEMGIFSAAVADYRPPEVKDGKIPSGGAIKGIELVPTVKVIDEVREKFPKLKMISFKYQENLSHDNLISIAKERLKGNDCAVIANRGEETGPNGDQIAWLISKTKEPQRLTGKSGIAIAIADFLESIE